jgi:tetratricopeptide (TPR) repeat protein
MAREGKPLMATKKHRVLTWVILLTLLAPVAVLGYVALEVLFLEQYRDEHGYSSQGANHKWHIAMNAGDAEAAKYWANRMIHYASDSPALPDNHPRSSAHAYRCLAGAYELAGEYKEALALYRECPRDSLVDPFSSPLAQARVYYRMGRKEDAFRAYCEFGAAWQNRMRSATLARDQILGGKFPYEKALSPFRRYDQFGDFMRRASYDEFLDFMRGEWEKTGKAEEYREAMDFLESLR